MYSRNDFHRFIAGTRRETYLSKGSKSDEEYLREKKLLVSDIRGIHTDDINDAKWINRTHWSIFLVAYLLLLLVAWGAVRVYNKYSDVKYTDNKIHYYYIKFSSVLQDILTVKRKKNLSNQEKFSVKTAKFLKRRHKRSTRVIFCYHPSRAPSPKISLPSIWPWLFKGVRQWGKISL